MEPVIAKNNLAKNIKYLRKKRDVSQQQLAFHVKKRSTAVSSWEGGLSEPGINELLILSAFFMVSLDELVTADLANVHLNTEKIGEGNAKNVHLNVHPSVHLNAKKGEKAPALEENLGNIAADEGAAYNTIAAIVNAAVTGALRPIKARLEGLERAVFQK